MTPTNEPPNTEPLFRIGDAVTLTNEYGAVFAGKTVVGVEVWSWRPDEYRYFLSPTDTPWFSTPERLLDKAPATTVATA